MSVASSCSSVTEVVVVVDGDVRDVDTVTVEVEGSGNVVVTRKTVTLGGRTKFPLTLGLRAGDTENGSFLVRAEASRRGEIAVSRVVRSRLVPGESRVLVVSLCQACDGVTCVYTESCNASGTCEEIPPELELPRWSGSEPRHACRSPAVETDGGADAAPEASVLEGGYHELTDSRLWSTFDMAARIDPRLRGYVGAAFDRRHVYFAPYGNAGVTHGNVVSYDTEKGFDDPASWSWFDLTTLDPNARGYAGAATFIREGKTPEYVYLVPFQGKSGGGDVVARLKVGDALKDWSVLPLGAHPPTTGAAGLGGAVVNFSHVWMPSRDPARPFVLHENRVAQNPQRLLDAGWASFDARGTLDAGAGKPVGGYYGGAFDLGNRLFFAPFQNESGPHGIALVKEVGSGTTSGWTTFDLTAVSPKYRGFAGAVFARGHVYYVPHANANNQRHGNVVRYDTLGDFTSTAAWTGVDLTTFHPSLQGFVGGIFDGRFVYFVPFNSDGGIVVARYDTTNPSFEDASAWSWFDIRTVSPAAARFNGAAFDGKYIYFIPYDNGVVVRFDARETRDPSLTYANGSFL